MGYFYLVCVSVLFSFGGTFAKLLKPYLSSNYITFFRFAVGVLFLLALKLVLRQGFRRDFFQSLKKCGKWIVIGAAAKTLAYLTENYALLRGPSYGNIITQPAQAVFITIVSYMLFREKITRKKLLCMALCLMGVLLISWNGRPMETFFRENLLLLVLFIISGMCAGAHVLAQKMVADRMDNVDSNLSMFVLAAAMSALFLIPDAAANGLPDMRMDIMGIVGLLGFGFNTGIGFYLNAKAIPLVPLFMVPIIQSMMVIYAIIWGALFFGEAITGYVIGGTAIFMVGLVALQLLNSKDRQEAAQ
ncbi:MAG: DMT family transporter [Clostridia bacterium]|nr:DMT family transporter [Clostridia bacterium]